jgi:hypothetical protein
MTVNDLGRCKFLLDSVPKTHGGAQPFFFSSVLAVAEGLTDVKSVFEIEENLPQSSFALSISFLIINASNVPAISERSVTHNKNLLMRVSRASP